jgi:hypothetical protein
MVLIPRSGTPKEFAATPPPDKYNALNPLAAASRALKAVMAPTTCKGRSSISAARSRAPGELAAEGAFDVAM